MTVTCTLGGQGLEDAISVSVVHPTWQRTKPDSDDEHTGWAFADPNGPPFTSSTGLQRCRHGWLVMPAHTLQAWKGSTSDGPAAKKGMLAAFAIPL